MTARSQKKPSLGLASRLSAKMGGDLPPMPSEAEARQQTLQTPAVAPTAADRPASTRRPAREGKVQLAGYFSPEMARSVKMLSVQRGVSIQYLIGEGLDMVMRANDKSPFGER